MKEINQLQMNFNQQLAFIFVVIRVDALYYAIITAKHQIKGDKIQRCQLQYRDVQESFSFRLERYTMWNTMRRTLRQSYN